MLSKILNLILGSKSDSEKVSSQKDEKLLPQLEFAKKVIDFYWTNNEGATEGMPNKRIDSKLIEKRANDLLNDCIHIYNSDNPLMENRKYLANSVLACSQLQVLVIKPAPGADETGLRGVCGISGELQEKLLDLIKVNKKFKEYFHAVDEELTYDLVWSTLLQQYRWSWSDMLIFNALRDEFNDSNPTTSKDWFRPFYASMCAYSEATYRQELKMPNNFGESTTNLIALCYSTYLNFVMKGDKYPDLTWEESYPNLENPKDSWILNS